MQSNSLSNTIKRQPSLISSRVIGVLVLVFIESMFFSALISSYFVMKKGRQIWDTAGSVHLPTLSVGFNTALLLLSGIPLFIAGHALRAKQDPKLAATHLFRTIILGVCFLAFQLFIDIQLINSGLTINSSVFGGCYHLIIGAHLFQAVLGLVFMKKLHSKLNTTETSLELNDYFNSVQVFWLFVIGIWPVLYAEIFF